MRTWARQGVVGWTVALLACEGGTVNEGDAPPPRITVRVSLSSTGGEGAGASSLGSLSGDGAFLGFSSDALGLHPEVANAGNRAYVKDLRTGELTLVSRATGPTGAVASQAVLMKLSRNGRRVAFAAAPALDPAVPALDFQVYVRDLDTLQTTLVSRGPGAGASANTFTLASLISGDGQRVAFASPATNLLPEDVDAITDIYLRDLGTGSLTLISRASGVAGAKGNGYSSLLGISEDGTRILFGSLSTNLTSDVLPPMMTTQIFLRDLGVSPPVTRLVSRAAGASGAPGAGLNDQSGFDMSPDGRYLVFASSATNLHPDDADAIDDIFLRDLSDDSMELISRGSGVDGPKGLAMSSTPRVSRDGRYVAFLSFAANFTPEDHNGLIDAYLRDRVLATTVRVSLRTFGSEIARGVEQYQLSMPEDASKVVFASRETDIVDDDSNGFLDIFLRSPLR